MIDTNMDIIRSDRDLQKVRRRIIKGWMESPGHRENILREEFTHLGVGVYATTDDIYATQLFGRPLVISRSELKRAYSPCEKVELELSIGLDLHGWDALNVFVQPPQSDHFGSSWLHCEKRQILPIHVQRSYDFLHLIFRLGKRRGTYTLSIGYGNSYYRTLRFPVK